MLFKLTIDKNYAQKHAPFIASKNEDSWIVNHTFHWVEIIRKEKAKGNIDSRPISQHLMAGSFGYETSSLCKKIACPAR